ncbi:hypothetical protein C8Q74DRAFT_861215 [Fomes fomentarius]|nr:hypothetical protein C8Q74DRAFT_861215 [Fomes fomentarius]
MLLAQNGYERIEDQYAAAANVMGWTGNAFITSFNKTTWLNPMAIGLLLAADTLLTAVLVVTLRQSRTGIQKTDSTLDTLADSTLDTLVLYAITTGLLSSVLNACSFILSLIFPSNFIWITVNFICARTYGNNMLAALNARERLARRGEVTFCTADVAAMMNAIPENIQPFDPNRTYGIEGREVTRTSTSAIELELKTVQDGLPPDHCIV